MILATVIDQWIGFGLIVFFAGWVCADATRPKVRRTRTSWQSPKRLPKLTEGQRQSDS